MKLILITAIVAGILLGCETTQKLESPAMEEPLMQRQISDKWLQAISDRFDVFQAIRGNGLLIGCVVSQNWSGRAREFLLASQDAGVLTLVAGGDVLRLAPSLIIPEADITEGLERLEGAVANLCAVENKAASS